MLFVSFLSSLSFEASTTALTSHAQTSVGEQGLTCVTAAPPTRSVEDARDHLIRTHVPHERLRLAGLEDRDGLEELAERVAARGLHLSPSPRPRSARHPHTPVSPGAVPGLPRLPGTPRRTSVAVTLRTRASSPFRVLHREPVGSRPAPRTSRRVGFWMTVAAAGTTGTLDLVAVPEEGGGEGFCSARAGTDSASAKAAVAAASRCHIMESSRQAALARGPLHGETRRQREKKGHGMCPFATRFAGRVRWTEDLVMKSLCTSWPSPSPRRPSTRPKRRRLRRPEGGSPRRPSAMPMRAGPQDHGQAAQRVRAPLRLQDRERRQPPVEGGRHPVLGDAAVREAGRPGEPRPRETDPDGGRSRRSS